MAEPGQEAPGRPAGIAGVRLPGPFPVGTYAAAGADSLVAVPTGDKASVVRALAAGATVSGGQAVA